MLQHLISQRSNEWLSQPDCPVRDLLAYIRQTGKLRDAQICAIQTYLFLKIVGQNRPLGELFAEGFFNENYGLDNVPVSQHTREVLENKPAARALFEFARRKVNNKAQLPELETLIEKTHAQFEHERVINDIFYKTNYTDYLFSLPMGAGKTFLMAAYIYLDLYFASQEPDNPAFAHNFIVLAPSGMKSSILPSLKTIERFNPAWVIPEPVASDLKRLLKFEVLDQPRTAKKSNRIKNPNAQKIANYQPFESLIGLVMVVNAEKVILDRLDIKNQLEVIERTDDEKDRQANELRNLIGKIPNLCIHIDEVHHAATDDIKLRQVVNRWNMGHTITAVIGYSGTPFLASPEAVEVLGNTRLRFGQITNTVEYYPLKKGIGNFLKRPRIKATTIRQPLEIIRQGVTEFYQTYANTRYDDNTVAKLAIYCGSIERLEDEVFPFLVGEMNIAPDDILKYHKGNKNHKLPAQNEVEFLTLDTPLSTKRVVLLVQIGKEGWDCRSLTGVILSQQGDCPTNMVLQTACRCLREVTSAKNETALIYLNEGNEKILDKQLRDEQHTSIDELNKLGKTELAADMVERYSRVAQLKLPPVDYYRLNVQTDTLIIDETPQTGVRLAEIIQQTNPRVDTVVTRDLDANGQRTKDIVAQLGHEPAQFGAWLHRISKASFGAVSYADLLAEETRLRLLFDRVTYAQNGHRCFNELFDLYQTEQDIRLAFRTRRTLRTTEEIIPEQAQLLLFDKIKPIARHDKLYPADTDVVAIREADESGKSPADLQAEKNAEIERNRQSLSSMGMGHIASGIPDITLSQAVTAKDRSFHVLPYSFKQSKLERDFLRECLSLNELTKRSLELYFNGERELTSFRIECFKKIGPTWRTVGLYTPDFLLVERNANGQMHKILIIETKGSGFQDEKGFTARRAYMENHFVPMNNEQFGYARFDYLFVSDDDTIDQNMATLLTAVHSFFA